jgi:SAM-dependent methyltransferase
MISVTEVLKWTITLGGTQNFLGARWVRRVLERTPEDRKRARALWLLSLSPHYFHLRNAPEYAELSESEYREAYWEAGYVSRRKIYDEIFAGMELGRVVMDYGCGGGFFARALAENVDTVYACDVSPGTIACAKVVSPSDNIVYVVADREGLKAVPDAGVDTIISLNMVHHLTAATYERVLRFMAQKIRPGGRLILHIQLPAAGWKTEEEWRADRSIRGRLKLRFGIHCFSLAAEKHEEMVTKAGFTDISIRPVSDYTSHKFDDIGDQHILTAITKAGG